MKGLVEECGFAGCYEYSTMTISIDANLPPEEALITLIHEIGHAIFHRGGLSQAKVGRATEEIICEQFATVLAENFKLSKKKK